MKKTKIPFIFGALVLSVWILAACAPAAQTQVVERVVTQEVEVERVVTQEVEVERVVTQEVQVEVERVISPIIYNSYNSDPDPRAVDEKLVSLYNELNPDKPIQHSIVNHEDFKQAIRAYLVADPAPDVMTWFAGNRARFFIDRGLIMDISDVWENEGWNEAYPKGFRALSEVDGKAYFLPSSWYWWAIFYRPSIFEANNITPPETWDELLTPVPPGFDAGQGKL